MVEYRHAWETRATTFSTFALETVTYGQAGTLAISALNLGVNNIGGLLLVLLGIWVGRTV